MLVKYLNVEIGFINFESVLQKCYYLIRGGFKKVGGAHHKVAYPPSPHLLWSKYHKVGNFFLLRIP